MNGDGIRIGQFTDLHLTDADDLSLLRTAMLDAVQGWGVSLLIVSGDLVQRGSTTTITAYAEAMADLPVPVITAIGNHDDREAFVAGVDPLPAGPPAEGGTTPHAGVVESQDIRVLVLDSNVNDDGNGRLSRQQLEWARRVLATPGPRLGTLLVVHHPPFTSPLRSLERPLMHGTSQLAEVLEGTDTRMIVSGHYHHMGASSIGGVTAWVGPAFCWETDLSSASKPERLQRRGWTLVRMRPDSADCTAIQIGATA